MAKPFNFRSTTSKPLERAYVNEGNTQAASIMAAATGGDKLKEKLAKPASAKTRSSAGGPPVKQPSSTRKDVLLQERRRQELEAKKAAEEAKAAEDAARKARQNQVSDLLNHRDNSSNPWHFSVVDESTVLGHDEAEACECSGCDRQAGR